LPAVRRRAQGLGREPPDKGKANRAVIDCWPAGSGAQVQHRGDPGRIVQAQDGPRARALQGGAGAVPGRVLALSAYWRELQSLVVVRERRRTVLERVIGRKEKG